MKACAHIHLVLTSNTFPTLSQRIRTKTHAIKGNVNTQQHTTVTRTEKSATTSKKETGAAKNIGRQQKISNLHESALQQVTLNLPASTRFELQRIHTKCIELPSDASDEPGEPIALISAVYDRQCPITVLSHPKGVRRDRRRRATMVVQYSLLYGLHDIQRVPGSWAITRSIPLRSQHDLHRGHVQRRRFKALPRHPTYPKPQHQQRQDRRRHCLWLPTEM